MRKKTKFLGACSTRNMYTLIVKHAQEHAFSIVSFFFNLLFLGIPFLLRPPFSSSPFFPSLSFFFSFSPFPSLFFFLFPQNRCGFCSRSLGCCARAARGPRGARPAHTHTRPNTRPSPHTHTQGPAHTHTNTRPHKHTQTQG